MGTSTGFPAELTHHPSRRCGSIPAKAENREARVDRGTDVRCAPRSAAHSLLRRAGSASTRRDEVDIIEAADGQEAIAKIIACNGLVDLVLCDVNMPRVHGFSFVKSIRGSPKLRDIPVILVTADDSDETAKQALREGAAGLITKPFDSAVICDIVTRIRRRGRRSASGVFKTEMVSKMAKLIGSAGMSRDEPGQRGLGS